MVMKRILSLISLLLPGTAALAQDTAGTSFLDDPLLPVYFIIGLVVIIALLICAVGFYLVSVLNMLATQAEKEKAAREGKVYTPKPSWWTRLVEKLNAAVPVEQEKNIELDHNFDGIKELDNHLPPWWKWLFYGTIGWSVIYIIVFHFMNSLPLSAEEYENEMAIAQQEAIKRKASSPQVEIDEASLQYAADPAILEKGKKVFMNNSCGACHRNDGGGNTIGPNLTDEYWLHGGDVKSIYTTIKNGVVEKGMPAWGKSMSPEDVRDVTFFVISLKGTNPENAKAPQGDLYQEQPQAVTDTLTVQVSLR